MLINLQILVVQVVNVFLLDFIFMKAMTLFHSSYIFFISVVRLMLFKGSADLPITKITINDHLISFSLNLSILHQLLFSF